MTQGQAKVSPLRMAAMIVVFPAIGPAVGAALVSLLFAALGIAALGVGASSTLTGFFIVFIATIYAVLGPPFLLTGIFYAVAARVTGSQSVVTALLAAAAGFAVYLAGLFLIKGSLSPLGFESGAAALYDLQVAGMLALPGLFLCWWLVSARSEPRPGKVNTPG